MELEEELQTEPVQEHYAAHQLKEAVKTIQLYAKEMPELRIKVDQYLDKNREKAKGYRDDLLYRKYRLLDVLETCRLSLMEAEQPELARFAYKIAASLEQFQVMTPDYSKFTGVLQAFVSKVNEGKTSAAVIGRLMASVRMGYYPTDLAHIRQIARGIAYPECRVNLFDPCCGCGQALYTLGQGHSCETYGVEIDTSRAEEAQSLLSRVGYGNYFQSRISHECFHLMLLNPPYLSVYTENGGKARHEKRFLAESFDRLVKGGVLVYIIPYSRLTADIARILCDNFTDLSVYRFSGAEFRSYHQIAVIGIRQKRTDGEHLVPELIKSTLYPDKLPELSELPEGRYPLPDRELEIAVFKGAQFNIKELQAELSRSKPFEAYCRSKDAQTRERHPLLPFKVDQIGLIGAAGEINGYVGEGEPHVLKGMVYKSTYHNTEITATDEYGRPLRTEDTYTVTNKLAFNVLTQSGYKELSA